MFQQQSKHNLAIVQPRDHGTSQFFFFLEEAKMKFIQNAKNPSKHNAWLGHLNSNIQRKSVPYICGTPKQTPIHQIQQTSTNKPKTPSTKGTRSQ
jgi:hypothetical protein